jgi:hypothetical protein
MASYTDSRSADVLSMIQKLPDRNRKAFKDIFYTQPHVIETAMEWLKTKVQPIRKAPLEVLDFSAGDGLFGDILKRSYPRSIYHAFDLHPTSNEVEQADFFALNEEQKSRIFAPDVACFNPPFGREGRDALRFWRQALTYRPKWLLLILPFRPWSLSNMTIIERKPLPPNSFYTVEDGEPFSTAAEMLLIRCNYTLENIVMPTVTERKEFPFEVTDTRQHMRLPSASMLLVRKVGHYAGKQCYVLSKKGDAYTCNYVSLSHIDGNEAFAPPVGGGPDAKWPTSSTPWGRRGHIVCWNDEAVTSTRGGQGFLKVYLPPRVTHEGALALARRFVDYCVEKEVAFGSPKTINCAIARAIIDLYCP